MIHLEYVKSIKSKLFPNGRFQLIDLLAHTFGEAFDLHLGSRARAECIVELIVGQLADNAGEPSDMLDRDGPNDALAAAFVMQFERARRNPVNERLPIVIVEVPFREGEEGAHLAERPAPVGHNVIIHDLAVGIVHPQHVVVAGRASQLLSIVVSTCKPDSSFVPAKGLFVHDQLMRRRVMSSGRFSNMPSLNDPSEPMNFLARVNPVTPATLPDGTK